MNNPLKLAILAVITLISLAGCDSRTSSPSNSDGSDGRENPLAAPIPGGAQEILDRHTDLTDASWRAYELAPPDFGLAGDPDSLYNVFSITFLWGPLASLGASAPAPLDWSGRLSASVPSAMHVRALIDFDHGQDSLLPRDNKFHLRWVSVTDGDFDGMSILVFVPKHSMLTVIPELFFDTEALQVQWPFSELEKFDAFYPVDNSNGLIIHARKIHPPFCARGKMEGKWIKSNSFDDHGRFEGFWLNDRGDSLGYLSGRYFTTPDNKRVLEGSISGLITDQVIAHLRGTWIYDDPHLCPVCGIGHGLFRGHIKMLNSGARGVFHGEFGDFSLPPDDLVMPFSGVWKLGCRDISAD
ncbi:MAG: hypothetical protein IH914_09690 [candidate division Zixibacteria bacterium]|nr:hypothetical protein [candidate division Zixibacteria bacterium]